MVQSRARSFHLSFVFSVLVFLSQPSSPLRRFHLSSAWTTSPPLSLCLFFATGLCHLRSGRRTLLSFSRKFYLSVVSGLRSPLPPSSPSSTSSSISSSCFYSSVSVHSSSSVFIYVFSFFNFIYLVGHHSLGDTFGSRVTSCVYAWVQKSTVHIAK